MNIGRHFVVAVALAAASAATHADLQDGAVYLMTNQPTNAVIAFERKPNGTLTRVGRFLTGGSGDTTPVPGSGDPSIYPLASQGSLVLSDDGRFLFAVNARSDEISVFAIGEDEIELMTTRFIGAQRPISVTTYGDLLYVLSDGLTAVGPGAASITGFRIGESGFLTPVADSKRMIASGSLTDPAQIAFSPSGLVLAVTDKLNNLIYTFPVLADGLTGEPVVTPSNGVTPFGFAFDGRAHMIVSEAARGRPGESSASSYGVQSSGAVSSISNAIPNSQTIAGWLAITPDRRFVYVSNAGSGQVSSYRLRPDGRIELIASSATDSAPSTGPIDLAVSRDGQNLYVHQSRRQSIAVFNIRANGELTRTTGFKGLPFGAQGIAVY